ACSSPTAGRPGIAPTSGNGPFILRDEI
ncbi:unnamed protein product, partial [Cercopithifilaria johnstoni]